MAVLLHRERGIAGFRLFSLYMAGATLILLADALGLYGSSIKDDLEPILAWVSAAAFLGGSGLVALALPRMSMLLVRRPISRLYQLLSASAILPFACLAVAARIGHSPFFYAAWDVVLLSFHVHSAMILIAGHERIENAVLHRFCKVLFGFCLGVAPVLLAQPFLRFAPLLPRALRDIPFPGLLFFLGVAVISIGFALRYFFPCKITLKNDGGCDGLIRRFGVSRRECEIIQLLVDGKDTKEIAEQLFISVNTVKNHVHSIYQKTDVKNKVQLFNIVNKNNI